LHEAQPDLRRPLSHLRPRRLHERLLILDHARAEAGDDALRGFEFNCSNQSASPHHLSLTALESRVNLGPTRGSLPRRMPSCRPRRGTIERSHNSPRFASDHSSSEGEPAGACWEKERTSAPAPGRIFGANSRCRRGDEHR
jgi:hypothetical protein